MPRSGARWTLLGPENADFSATSSQDAAPSISYTVNNAPKGGQVKVTVKFTSTAGVGEKAWTQPVEGGPPAEKFAGSISGTAKYDSFELGEGNSLSAEWSGSVELKQDPPFEFPGFPVLSYNYKLTSGSITYSFTGSVGECHVEGGGPIDLGAQFDVTSAVSLSLLQGEPRPYSLSLPMPVFEEVPGTASSCEDPEDEGAFDWNPGAGLPLLARSTADEGRVLNADESFSGSASGNTGSGSPDQTWQWSMAPVP